MRRVARLLLWAIVAAAAVHVVVLAWRQTVTAPALVCLLGAGVRRGSLAQCSALVTSMDALQHGQWALVVATQQDADLLRGWDALHALRLASCVTGPLDVLSPVAPSSLPRFSYEAPLALADAFWASTHLVRGPRAAHALRAAGSWAHSFVACPAPLKCAVQPWTLSDAPAAHTLYEQLDVPPGCADERALAPRSHSVLCVSSLGAHSPLKALHANLAALHCDWALATYDTGSTTNADVQRALELRGRANVRALLRVPGSIKVDVWLALTWLAREYQYVLWLDSDIYIGTEWSIEHYLEVLLCSFGHVPVLSQPAVRQDDALVLPFLHASGYSRNVRAAGVPMVGVQVWLMRAPFFEWYFNAVLRPLVTAPVHAGYRSDWLTVDPVCLGAAGFEWQRCCRVVLRSGASW